MALDPKELAAFADGELPEARAAEVAAQVEGDPDLARQLAAHERLKAILQAHYAPVLDAPVPGHLTALLAPKATDEKVVDFSAAREKRRDKRRLPRWSWVAAPALAASLALALILPRGGQDTPEGYARPQLASLLDNRLVAEQSPSAQSRILLSFQDETGRYCRAFSGAESSGIACHDPLGWKLEALGAGGKVSTGDYRMAGAADAELMARAQEMAEGPALDAKAEAEAKAKGWRGLR